MGCVSSKTRTIQNRTLPLHPQHSSKLSTAFQIASIPVTSSIFLRIGSNGLNQNYQTQQLIQQRPYSKILKSFHQPTKQIRVVKSINKSQIKTSKLSQSGIPNQLLVHQQLDHPSIIRVFQLSEDLDCYHIVSQHLQGESLLQRVLSQQKFSQTTTKYIMIQLLSALAHCHSKNIIHRDIKPQNLIFRSQESYGLSLIDFGAALLTSKRSVTGFFGSPFYVAPEVFNGVYNEKCDLYSSGVVMNIMLTGEPPYTSETLEDIQQEAFLQPLRKRSSNLPLTREGIQFLSSLLAQDPTIRMSAQVSLTHPWIIKAERPLNKEKSNQVFHLLQNYLYRGKLREVAQIFMALHVSGQDLEQLRNAFTSLDIDRDGRLSKEDIQTFYRRHVEWNYVELEVNKMMELIDRDRSGFIDFTEFLTATLKNTKFVDRNMIEFTFQRFDMNSDGVIGTDDIKELLVEIETPNQMVYEELLEEVDTNNDGVVDLIEFVKLMEDFLENE